MVEENPRDVGHEMDGLSIVYGDEALPRLYENSRISSEQLPSQQLGKYCVGCMLPLFNESCN
jgi:transcription elongation factor SPT6